MSDLRILLDFDGDRRSIHADEQSGGDAQLKSAFAMKPEEIVGGGGRVGAARPRRGRLPDRPQGLVPAQGQKAAYLCVNADESEPGTFKDREIMLRNPHALIEGILIVSFAIGATSAFIYIRGEYLTEFEVLRRALEEAARAATWGETCRLGLRRDRRPARGAGAYICGEETALLSLLEGERGQPRSKPPFPAVAGLYAAPTLVNNVETLASLFILAMGGEAYAKIGTERSKGNARVASATSSPSPATTSCR